MPSVLPGPVSRGYAKGGKWYGQVLRELLLPQGPRSSPDAASLTLA